MPASRSSVLLAPTVLVLVLATCRSPGGEWVVPEPMAEDAGTRIHIQGVIEHSDLEGGFYLIKAEDGTTYDPTNLPPEFHQHGLAVEAEARRRDDLVGIHQVGPIIQLERIRTR
jgi:hypothetical protein